MSLFLDGLYEGLSTIESLGKLLQGQFGSLEPRQRERLWLRLTCRTADWQRAMGFLGARLAASWGPENFALRELAPLREQDVSRAAAARGLDPAAFLDEVRMRDITALANRPVTLDFLLDIFATHEALPSGAAQLFERGCRRLCETSAERGMREHPGAGDPGRRLAVASRIAAVTVLANRPAIWLGPDPEMCPPQAVSVQNLVGGIAERTGNRRNYCFPGTSPCSS